MPKQNRGKKARVPKATRAYVKGQLTRQLETKYYNRFNQTISTDYSGSLVDLTALIAQGITVAGRVGDRIDLRSIEWRGQITSADSHNFVRFALVQFRENSTAGAPVIGDWLETVNNTLAPTTLWNWDRRTEYRVLWDKTYYVDTGDDYALQFAGKIPSTKLKTSVHYDPGVNTGSNHVYLLIITDSAAVTHPSVSYDMRITYKDA